MGFSDVDAVPAAHEVSFTAEQLEAGEPVVLKLAKFGNGGMAVVGRALGGRWPGGGWGALVGWGVRGRWGAAAEEAWLALRRVVFT